MFRKAAWRNAASDAVSFHQDQALSTTILLLKSFGPTGFLLREDGEAKDFKVCLGDPHTCTCPVFTREQEPCKHICWVLLRRFRLPREHEYSFQHGLVERQILEVLQGSHQTEAHRTGNDASPPFRTASQPITGQKAGSVCRKVIQAQDVCPICQEELLEKKLPVSYCRFGCGNNVHISCMKVWADHQRLSDREDTVKCPLCREDFSSLKSLQEQVKNAAKLFTAAEREKPQRHLGVLCRRCRACPVTGKCFRCTVCSYFYLCEDCSKQGCHPQHPFASRTTRREKWRLVADDLSDAPTGATCQPASGSTAAADTPSHRALEGLPAIRVRPGSRLLDEGQQCRICLQDFSLGQRVRTLPCQHQFHADCVDGILQKSNSCPLDGYVIYDPLTRRTRERKSASQVASRLLSDFTKPTESHLKDLFIPGVALRDRNTKVTPPRGSL
ncbi:E3 ubiquitin-protein ligase Zswim2, partial [Nibea albiflora]